ncbi:hypothetical protein LAZ67_14001825 [Cordylochernes scorpioides]|uniref:Mos1 transposase HTH domain-containing protein n=1 Tax=Cordylochernes scorpioides TaxID=51811 RepID=A0ABY6L6A9_9ARAC|nr:hypothetical protein LAZ67_14001825 [Cordylochernes scorpioides]
MAQSFGRNGVLERLRFLPIKKNGSKNLYKILCENEIKCVDAFRMLTVAYGEATLDRSNVYRWYKMFSEGREDVNDEERAGRPSTSTTDEKINEVEKMIMANCRITAREVAEDLNISNGSCHSIFINDLGMRRVAAKFVPKLLNCDQKQHSMNIANEMLDSVRDDPNLIQRVITGDEAWVYGYDVETKAQSSQWKLPHEPRPEKARQVRSNVKVLLTVFFDCRGVVYHEFLPQGRTVWNNFGTSVRRLGKRLTRILKTTEEFLSSTPPIPVENIENNREVIEETHSELLVIRGKIIDFMLTSDVSEEELEQDDEEALQYTQRYKRILNKCLALVKPKITASSPTTSEVSIASSSHHRAVKLPKIELKKFTGEIKDWLGWWSQFNKMHVNPTLEDSDKFHYLVQSMSPGTRASKLVDSYTLNAENYPKVIETLTERFGRPELLQQIYVRDIIRLIIDCSTKQQLKVTSFYDELVTHLRALKSLKIEARQMYLFIFPMIEACLSEELIKIWQRSSLHDVKIDANDSTQTRVDLIMEFLQKEATAEQDKALA